MNRIFYEVVLEGHFDTIHGLFEGFMLGRKKKYQYWFSNRVGIEAETLSEVISEWVTFKHKVHHIIMDENLYKEFKAVLEDNKDHRTIDVKFVKSVKRIESASYNFEFSTYGKKYANRFKELIKSYPTTLEIENYKEDEDYADLDGGRVLDAYPTDHEYEFYANGAVTGELGDLINFRQKMMADPLIVAKRIHIK